MQKHWDSLSDSGWHDLVAGLVKDTQIEAALEALQAMFAARVPVEGWLYEMVIYSLCDLGELDEALRVMIHRVSAGHDIGRSSWYHLFDVGCSKLHVSLKCLNDFITVGSTDELITIVSHYSFRMGPPNRAKPFEPLRRTVPSRSHGC